MMKHRNLLAGVLRMAVIFTAVAFVTSGVVAVGEDAKTALAKIGTDKGICVVLGAEQPSLVTGLAQGSELTIYFQSPDAREVAGVRTAAEAAGLLGTRVFVDQGDFDAIHLADNLADAVLVSAAAGDGADREEILRVLHPEGKALLGDRTLVKPFPEGIDRWDHPYHSPNNNPQSTDQLARAPYLTQFLADPKFSPMPEQTVAAAGRIFKAFGHIAHRANQNVMLNKLLGINGYNGTTLWQRDLPAGFMIHRNTMIATPETLYLADDESCKLIDAKTGETTGEIVIPDGLGDGPVWKWMALQDGVLYALVGGKEINVAVVPSSNPALGHWPWGMWQGHDYKDPKTNFGFGRTMVAIDTKTKKILWSHNEDDYLDARGLCMQDDRIYVYSPDKSLGCLDATSGKTVWKTSDAKLLAAIGPNARAQHYVTGYATSAYIKCNDRFLFFSGPQRARTVAVSAKDGKLLWQHTQGNLQLVLRDDAIYAAGPGDTGVKLDYETGDVIGRLPVRRACTRATGSVDSIFYRTTGGTVRIDVAANSAHHVAPMRPPCQDGVIISDGLLYWGPWMCGCQLAFYGHICLAPAGEFDFRPGTDDSRLEMGPGDPTSVEPLAVQAGDWPVYRGNNGRSSVSTVAAPRSIQKQWTYKPTASIRPTAPVTAGGLIFVGDHSGAVRAIGPDGKVKWQARTGGAIYFPPAVAEGRVYVGSADGRVYALEATTGRLLWRFRAAPADRWISVYDKLISTWPVAGGVVVDNGVVYAAAGIAHYDGTHVYALDAVTGKVKWYNDSSGTVSEQFSSGVSLQGSLYLADGELRFLGGNVHQTARYDLATGKCLNEPNRSVMSQHRTAFYPYYPNYGKYISLHRPMGKGRSLDYAASYEGSQHSQLALFAPMPRGAQPTQATDRPTDRRRPAPKRPTIWQAKAGRVYNSFIVAPKTLITAGRTAFDPAAPSFLAAVDLGDGTDIWYELRRARAAIKQEAPPEPQLPALTQFSQVRA
ncbi:MAG: PQQ-binding-like beta-propeller repeat protein, partial [Thermoguttaceae bacterium]